MKAPLEHIPGSEDDLRASNEVLKLKLELEHGMLMDDTNKLPLMVENQWLQHVYDFEKQYKEAGPVSVWDFIGRPDFIKWESLTEDQLRDAVEDLMNRMEKKGVMLDFLCNYENRIVYRFITEEFFAHEIDNIIMNGGAYYFTYEEFHPNHDYDLRRFSSDFVKSVLSKRWNEFQTFVLGDSVCLHEKHYSRSGISSIIVSFQELHSTINLQQFTIQNVHIDLEQKKGIVRGDLAYQARLNEKEEMVEGPCILHFEMGPLDWDLVQFEIPGFYHSPSPGSLLS